jgi:hypothetical protein
MRQDTGTLYDAVDACLLTSAYEAAGVLLDGLAAASSRGDRGG